MPPETRVEQVMYARKLARKPRSTPKTKKRTTKPKKTQIGLWREWLVPDSAYHRFKGLRGVYWYWLSRQVRKEDAEKYEICITCLLPIEDWKSVDCGHIIASDGCGEYLRFFRLNLTAQHKGCNNPLFSPSAGVLNALHMEERHGKGTMEHLVSLIKKECKEPTTNEYKELIRALPSYQEALSLRKDMIE